MKKRRPFPGGYRFRRFAGQPADTLFSLEPPERVRVPLRQGFGDAVRPLVSVGEPVAAGQLIGSDDDHVCSPVHASLAGVVEAIREHDPEQGAPACIEIRAQTPGPLRRLEGFTAAWTELAVETIEDLLYRGGVTALGSGGIPTRHRSALIAPADVEAVIVHDTQSDMFNVSLPVLLGGGRLQAFAEGLAILRRVLRGAPVHVAVGDGQKAWAESLRADLAGREGVTVHVLASRYPQDLDGVLVPAVLGRPFPHGYTAAHIGVVTLDVQAVLHVRDAVVEGRPLVERIVALCGTGFGRTGHARVPVGMPLADVARQAGADPESVRLVKNSTLTGPELDAATGAVDRTFSAVVALPQHGPRGLLPFIRPGAREDAYSRTFLANLLPGARPEANASLRGELRPCVSCGYCQEVCPTGLLPHLLYKYAAGGYLEDHLVDELRIFDCIDCNLCSYVCPSKISVAQHIRRGREQLLKEGVDNAAHVRSCFNLKGPASSPSAET